MGLYALQLIFFLVLENIKFSLLVNNNNIVDFISLRGPTPFFLPILVIIIIFFMGEKVSSGIWETCPKILGGYEYQNQPPQMGSNIYIYNCMYHIIIIIISKNIS